MYSFTIQTLTLGLFSHNLSTVQCYVSVNLLFFVIYYGTIEEVGWTLLKNLQSEYLYLAYSQPILCISYLPLSHLRFDSLFWLVTSGTIEEKLDILVKIQASSWTYSLKICFNLYTILYFSVLGLINFLTRLLLLTMCIATTEYILEILIQIQELTLNLFVHNLLCLSTIWNSIVLGWTQF